MGLNDSTFSPHEQLSEGNTFQKSIIYRIWSLLISGIVIYVLTQSFYIVFIIEVIKLINYYIFEKVWKRVRK